jgi:hypothetical protein
MHRTRTLALAAGIAAATTCMATEALAERGQRGHGAQGAFRGATAGTRHGGGFRQGPGHWSGHRHWGGHRRWSGANWGLYFGAPVVFGAMWPYWGGYYGYPHSTVIYRESEPYPQSFPEGAIAPEPTTEVPRGEGTPKQGPLYMNYCASARAYFPKVTSCPEGWRLETPTS